MKYCLLLLCFIEYVPYLQFMRNLHSFFLWDSISPWRERIWQGSSYRVSWTHLSGQWYVLKDVCLGAIVNTPTRFFFTLHTSVWLDFYSHLVITSAVQSGDFAYLLKVLFYHFPNDWSSAGWWIIFTLVCNKEANMLFDYFSVHGGDIWERHILSFIVLCYLLRANIIILTTCYI